MLELPQVVSVRVNAPAAFKRGRFGPRCRTHADTDRFCRQTQFPWRCARARVAGEGKVGRRCPAARKSKRDPQVKRGRNIPRYTPGLKG